MRRPAGSASNLNASEITGRVNTLRMHKTKTTDSDSSDLEFECLPNVGMQRPAQPSRLFDGSATSITRLSRLRLVPTNNHDKFVERPACALQLPVGSDTTAQNKNTREKKVL